MTVNENNLEKAKNLLKKIPDGETKILRAQDDNFNRKILEWGKFNIFVGIENNFRGRDKPKQLDSGLNHVLAKIASKNNVAMGIDLEEISKLNTKSKMKTLARIKQNIKICRKAKCKIRCLNYLDVKNATSFMITLGASTQQAKEATSF